MDHQTFDHLARLFGTAGSRRTAWRALLAGALLGATTRSAAAGPTAPCKHGKQELCGDECCPGRCFVVVSDFGDSIDACPICCTKENNLVICGDTCCVSVDELGNPIEDPCRDCIRPGSLCQEGLPGSYRRR